MHILIGGAWPYANGPLHIGHIAALLPGDVLARYHRAKGNDVYYVSGSDCHGTPVAIRAKKENRSPAEISDYYHHEFVSVFKRLGFCYDLYGKTSSAVHQDFVKAFHQTMYASTYIEERTAPQAYCETCGMTLTDRFVLGQCPACGASARGDQCDACGMVLEPDSLIHPRCETCGAAPVFHESSQLYLAVTKLWKDLNGFLESHPHWRKNAIAFTKRYLDEGLQDRAITRTLDWGIDVPYPGYEDKKIYIWAENVLGYLSMSYQAALQRNADFEAIWDRNGDARHYYVHGKDNIPFHTIILPSLLLANGGNWRLPDDIISSEYMTLEGRKISTSGNWAIWAKDVIERYDPDSLRYYCIANGPEKRDADFSWREYFHSHNSELLGGYGNFVNRSLVFISKYLDQEVPSGTLELAVEQAIEQAFETTGELLEAGACKAALENVFQLVRFGNQYFDSCQPWKTRETHASLCRQSLYNCVQIAANLSILLAPFLPFSSAKVMGWLGLSPVWRPQYVTAGYALPPVQPLFARLDQSVIEQELARLQS